MRDSPVARHGLAEVPMPLEPLGQSSRSLAGGSALGAGGGATTGGAALGLAADGFFSASSSQPARSVARPSTTQSLDEGTRAAWCPASSGLASAFHGSARV